MGFFKSSRNSSVDLLAGKEAFQRAIAKERYRSDRSDHKYSLLILSLAIKSEDDERIGRAITTIRQRIRAIDEIGWYEENQLGIILPFTPMEGADRLADEFNLRISNGYGDIKNKTFRIAHMGDINMGDLEELLGWIDDEIG